MSDPLRATLEELIAWERGEEEPPPIKGGAQYWPMTVESYHLLARARLQRLSAAAWAEIAAALRTLRLPERS